MMAQMLKRKKTKRRSDFIIYIPSIILPFKNQKNIIGEQI
jgi:hypothetical protein